MLHRVEQELPLIGGKADGKRVTLDPDQPTPSVWVEGAELYKLFAMQGQERVYYGYIRDGMEPDTALNWLFAHYRRPREEQ